MIHQIFLEIIEVLGHRDTLFLTLHKGNETVWNLNIDTEDIIDLLLELRRMGGFAEHSHFARLQLLFERAISACAVRVERVTSLGKALAHGFADLLVVVGGSADERRDALVGLFRRQLLMLRIEVDDAGKVAWVAHIHSVGKV